MFEDNILAIYQEEGRAWLARLPEQVLLLEHLWGLSHLKPYVNLSYNYVLSGYQNQTPIILKLGIDRISLDREAKTLQAFMEHGAVAVLDCRADALLLQRAVPGHSLKEYQPCGKPSAIEITCNVIEKLHNAPVSAKALSNFPHIQEWLSTLDKEWLLPQSHLQRARLLKKQLLPVQTSSVLLHGDLHRGNILSNGDEWLVIDPKGVIGFPINEVWTCVEEPYQDLQYIAKRCAYNFDDLVKWYYVHAIMAACWQVEDNLDPKRFLDLAESAWACIE